MLVEQLLGQTFGEVSVVDAKEFEGFRVDGRPHLYLYLVLSDPDGDHWSHESVQAIRHLVTEYARAHGIAVGLVTSHRRGQPLYRGPTEPTRPRLAPSTTADAVRLMTDQPRSGSVLDLDGKRHPDGDLLRLKTSRELYSRCSR